MITQIIDVLKKPLIKKKTVPVYVLIQKDENGMPDITGYALSIREGNRYCERNNIRERFTKIYVTPFYKGYLISTNKRLKCTTE